MPHFIDESLVLDGFIAADAEADIGPIEFKYRPANASEVTVWSAHRERLSGADAAKRDTEFVARHLVEWDIRDAEGKPVPINSSNCGRLIPRLFNRLLDIVAGYEIGDARPAE